MEDLDAAEAAAATMTPILEGWLLNAGPPFIDPVIVNYSGRSLVFIGPNGHGKTRLLRAIVDMKTPRIFRAVPPLLAPYLSYERQQIGERLRNRLEKLGRHQLVEVGENTAVTSDLADWWSEYLKVSDVLWLVAWSDAGHSRLMAASRSDPATSLASLPIADKHAGAVIERWATLDADVVIGLDDRTEVAFRAWASDVFQACGDAIEQYRNSLVASDTSGLPISLLPLATSFADLVGKRTSSRLKALCGFDIKLSCTAADNFLWTASMGGSPVALTDLSQAMSRWSALAALETLREFVRCSGDAAALELATHAADLVHGDVPESVLPVGQPMPFSTRSAWVAMDEPEVHLFASEARALGVTLAAHAHSGRTIIATHSLDMAAKMVGTCDFLTFDSPGKFDRADLPVGIENLLRSLARHGPGILSATRVLYVEGDWDALILRRLFGEYLSQNNILVSPVHGVLGAHLAITSIWHRMLDVPFGVMFDSLSASTVETAWAAVLKTCETSGRNYALKELRREMRSNKSGPHEKIGLNRLFESVLECELEDRLHLVMHGLSDIFQVIHPSVYGLDGDSWCSIGFSSRGQSFKDFILQAAMVELKDGRQCRLILNAFEEAGMLVEDMAYNSLADALHHFADSSTASTRSDAT